MARFRNAAHERKAAAEQAGERGGDRAYQQYRSGVPGVEIHGVWHRPVQAGPGRELRGERVHRSGKQYIHTAGYFTRYERGYPMWDKFGEYTEMTMRGSGTKTLAARPDVSFLIEHAGLALARSVPRPGMDPTLLLTEDRDGGYHEAWLNPDRPAAADLAVALDDFDVREMSFAFMIPEAGGLWSEDFDVFQILAWDIDGGDVTAVNRGANSHTDISLRSGEILSALEHLPEGAREEARARLGVDTVERQQEQRERIVVSSWAVDRSASMRQRLLAWRKANTARRMVELADSAGLSVRDLAGTALPWYEIRDSADILPEDGPDFDPAETADTTEILIYDEIGGSMGVSADQFAADLLNIDTPNISLRINSPGGSVFDALAIANSLRHHDSTITAYVDGMAASAATIVAMGADKVIVMPGVEMMVHEASSPDEGNKGEKAAMVTWLAKQDQNIAEQYAAKAGGTAAEWLAMMEAETWFLADEAVDAGLADAKWKPSAAKSKRFADDPRLTRSWDGAELPYRYERRAGAPQTQIRRATGMRSAVDESVEREIVRRLRDQQAGMFAKGGLIRADEMREISAEMLDRINDHAATMAVPDDPQEVAVANGSIQPAVTGRSIALITAQVEAEGGELS